jgi:outer membrane protein, multidrug efflux system
LIGVSEADLYPSISLLGSVGLSASSLNRVPNTLTWAIGPTLVWNVFDRGRLTYAVLVQDARFQQLHEQYQEAVLKAAREVDDSAVSFVKTAEQIPLLTDAVQAAERSLRIASLQYREGLTDYQRVIDTQRALFSQQDLLVTSRGVLAQSLIALYKAMGGGWEEGRSRPIVDEPTRKSLSRRGSWQRLLAAPLPPPDANPRANPSKRPAR